MPEEWLLVPEIKEAVALSETAAYSPGELLTYDKYWDAISIEKTLINGFYRQGKTEGLEEGRTVGLEEGLAKGLMEGRAEGRAEGKRESKLQIAKTLLAMGMPLDRIRSVTGLSLVNIQAIVSTVEQEIS